MRLIYLSFVVLFLSKPVTMFTGRFVPPQVIVIALFSLSQSTAFPAAKDVPKLTDDAWVQTRDLFWSSLHCLPHSRLQGSVHSNTELFRISIICSSDSPDKRKVPKYKHKHTYIVKVAMQHCENSQIKVQSNFSQTYSSFIWQINVIVGGVNVHVSWQFHRWSIIQHLSILMPNIFAMFFIPPCCLGYGTWIIYFLCLVRGVLLWHHPPHPERCDIWNAARQCKWLLASVNTSCFTHGQMPQLVSLSIFSSLSVCLSPACSVPCNRRQTDTQTFVYLT